MDSEERVRRVRALAQGKLFCSGEDSLLDDIYPWARLGIPPKGGGLHDQDPEWVSLALEYVQERERVSFRTMTAEFTGYMWMDAPHQCADVTDRPSAVRRLLELRDLKFDWDSYKSLPIDEGALLEAAWIMGMAESFSLSQPNPIPLSGGGVQLEYRQEPWFLHIAVWPGLEIEMVWGDWGKEEEWCELVVYSLVDGQVERALRWYRDRVSRQEEQERALDRMAQLSQDLGIY